MSVVSRFTLLAVFISLLSTTSSKAYNLGEYAWISGNITIQLQLGVPTTALTDGSTHWDDVATAALDEWNTSLVRCKLVRVKDSTAAKASGNRLNNVFFSDKIYGEAFGERTIAATLPYHSGIYRTEADVVVNSAKSWNSYRGKLTTQPDLRRVLLHEFGHVLGLNHPDEATPVQSVAAVMNKTTSDLDTLQADDREGAVARYGKILSVPSVGTIASQTVTAGSPLTLTYNSSNSDVQYTWGFKKKGGTTIRYLYDSNGDIWSAKSYFVFSAGASDAGTYYAYASNFAGSSPSPDASAVVTVNPVDTTDALLANLSARGRAGSGNETFIVGFVVDGTTKKSVLIRAIGPTLGPAGITTPLGDPKLTLYKQNGSNFTLVSENDNWAAVSAPQLTAVKNAFARLGAFPLQDSSKDSALLVDLDPGVYSAHVVPVDGKPGITLLEIYDADETRANAIGRRLINISTRSFAGVGQEKLVAGFVVGGPAPKQLLLRAVGPGLIPFGVTNVNTDPYIIIYKDGVPVAANDDWTTSNQGVDGILTPIFNKIGAFVLSETNPGNDSALFVTLPPGVYSAEVSGADDETGIVLLEVYEVPQ